MTMGLRAQYQVRDTAAANLNQAANTVLLQFFAPAGGYARRLHVIGDSAAGLLAAGVLKLSYSTDGGSTWTDVGNLSIGSARARGIEVYRTFDISAAKIPVNAIVAVRVGTDSGAASTATIGVEFEDEAYDGTSVPSTSVEVTS